MNSNQLVKGQSDLYFTDLGKIEKFLDDSNYEEAIERSLKILEKCLGYLYEKTFTKLELSQQSKIIIYLTDHYKGKNFYNLTIGEKLKVFNEFNLLSIPSLGINLDKEINSTSILKIIDSFYRINDLRVSSTHQKRTMTKGEAYYSYAVILLFLEKIGWESLISEFENKDSSIQKIDESSNKLEEITLDNLPKRDYTEFIGRDEKIKEIIDLLLHEKVHVLSIDGIGGVGKSSLALEIAYKLKEQKLFDAIIWVSAKKDRLSYKGIEEIINNFDNLEDLFDEILKVFNEADFLKHGTIETKERMVIELLRNNNCLIIVDNLETINDDNIKKFLIGINFPIESKVLITSRKRLGQVEHVIMLEKFTIKETEKFILSQLKSRSFKGECSENLIKDIYSKTGGIPLAIKVIIPWIIEGRIKNNFNVNIDKETDILKFCFDRVYNEFLNEDAKKLFCIMSLAPLELSEAAIKFISDLKDNNFNISLNSLINYSLICEVKKDNGSEIYYSMLPLTREFGVKTANIKYSNLKNNINRNYLKYIELSNKENYAPKQALAINKAEDARRLFLAGKIDDASYLFKEAIGYDANCDYALYLYAIFFKETQNFRHAIKQIEKAISIAPKNYNYWIEYAKILDLSGDFQNEEYILEEAVIKTEKNRYVMLELSQVKLKLQKNDEAINIAIENIIHSAKDKNDKLINTQLTIALIEGHWRISSDNYKSEEYNDAIDELLKGLNVLDDLNTNNLIIANYNRLLWEEKKTYHRLGDIALIINDKEAAKKYYKSSLYDVAFFEDRKTHNKIIEDKMKKIN